MLFGSAHSPFPPTVAWLGSPGPTLCMCHTSLATLQCFSRWAHLGVHLARELQGEGGWRLGPQECVDLWDPLKGCMRAVGSWGCQGKG